MTDASEFSVVDIVPEIPGTITLILQPTTPAKIFYEAGQFLTLIIESRGRSLRRSYSFSSTPTVDEHISITVKEVVNGEVSRALIRDIRKGTAIRALKPAGLFTLNVRQSLARDIFFIAAGSGIIPIFSLIKKVVHLEPQSRCILIYQNASKDQTIFYDDLLELEHRFPSQLTIVWLFSRETSSALRQRLHREQLEEIVAAQSLHDQHEARFFICGPKAFMRMAEFSLKSIGYTAEQIRQENFVVDQVPAPSFHIDDKPRKVEVHIREEVIQFKVSYPQNILQAALANNYELPYSCRGGRCSSCVAICLDGKLHMSINEVLTDVDLSNGLVLPCVAYAETDIVLQYLI